MVSSCPASSTTGFSSSRKPVRISGPCQVGNEVEVEQGRSPAARKEAARELAASGKHSQCTQTGDGRPHLGVQHHGAHDARLALRRPQVVQRLLRRASGACAAAAAAAFSYRAPAHGGADGTGRLADSDVGASAASNEATHSWQSGPHSRGPRAHLVVLVRAVAEVEARDVHAAAQHLAQRGHAAGTWVGGCEVYARGRQVSGGG